MPDRNGEERNGGADEIKWWIDIPLALMVLGLAIHHPTASNEHRTAALPTATPTPPNGHYELPDSERSDVILPDGSTSFE